MSAKINHIIPTQGFQLARDKSGEILAVEMANQFVLRSYDKDLPSKVYLERTMPFDKTELSMLNVSLSRGSYSNKNQGSVDGSYDFNIDAYTHAKTDSSSGGDILAAFKLHKILGICRAIFEDPIYKTLGFPPGLVSRVYCSEIQIAQNVGKDDAANTMMGRLILTVVLNEKTALIDPNMIAGYTTTLTINETDLGYFYQGGS